MTKTDLVYIKHIRDSINKILAYTRDVDQTTFLETSLVQDGVVRNLEIIGEAKKNLSTEFREKHHDIPWKDMAGMRDKLIHDYIGVDLLAVWGVVTLHLPKLHGQIVTLLED